MVIGWVVVVVGLGVVVLDVVVGGVVVLDVVVGAVVLAKHASNCFRKKIKFSRPVSVQLPCHCSYTPNAFGVSFHSNALLMELKVLFCVFEFLVKNDHD